MDPGTRGPAVDAGLRTSTRGVFAAGNLLHGAETADVCALEGRRVAFEMAAFLRDDAWPQGRVSLQAESPITWIFPNALSLPVTHPQSRSLAFRVSRFCRDMQVNVTQGSKTLHTQRFRSLSPNQSAHLDARWLKDAQSSGEPIRIATDKPNTTNNNNNILTNDK
jgi:hypothetical protein